MFAYKTILKEYRLKSSEQFQNSQDERHDDKTFFKKTKSFSLRFLKTTKSEINDIFVVAQKTV